MSRTSAARLTGLLASCGAIAALLLAGCGGPGTERPSSPTETTSPAPRTTPQATATTPPATTTTPDRPVPTTPARRSSVKRCKVAELTVSLRGEDGTAGTMYRGLVFTNTGRRTCTIQGFPGVSFVAGDDGHQVGLPAAWDGPKGPVVRLRPGAEATATLAFPNIGNFDPADCLPTAVRGLRVYPPHDTSAEFVPFETNACAGTPPGNHLRVRAVQVGFSLG